MKIRVSMPGAYTVLEVEEDKAERTFKKLNETLLGMKSTEKTKQGLERPTEVPSEVEEADRDHSDFMKKESCQGIRYKGFLYIRCEACGHVHGFYTKNEMNCYKCRDCGHEMVFQTPLAPIYVNCECGQRFRYMTNITNVNTPAFDIDCLQCGTPVAVIWNDKKRIFETIR